MILEKKVSNLTRIIQKNVNRQNLDALKKIMFASKIKNYEMKIKSEQERIKKEFINLLN